MSPFGFHGLLRRVMPVMVIGNLEAGKVLAENIRTTNSFFYRVPSDDRELLNIDNGTANGSGFSGNPRQGNAGDFFGQ